MQGGPCFASLLVLMSKPVLRLSLLKMLLHFHSLSNLAIRSGANPPNALILQAHDPCFSCGLFLGLFLSHGSFFLGSCFFLEASLPIFHVSLLAQHQILRKCQTTQDLVCNGQFLAPVSLGGKWEKKNRLKVLGGGGGGERGGLFTK